MSKAGTVAWVRHLRGHTFATPIVEAQFSVPPQIGLEPPQGALPARDISAEVERMTKRYGLSKDKAKIVHAILEEQARKADDVAKDNSHSPEEKAHRMLAIKDEVTTRVSDALTQERNISQMSAPRRHRRVRRPRRLQCRLQTSNESMVAADVMPLPLGE